MAPTVVYDGVQNNQPNKNGIFAGLKIWFSRSVPQRSRFIAEVKANGGHVVDLEKQAVICIYDHARKNPPPGTYSYRFVELSMRNGQLEDLGAHRVGTMDSRADRPVGSQTLASKGSRVSFTDEEDQILWEWMKPHEGQRGSAGNVLFQQLERQHPSHTYQSWRDRWLKYVQFQKRDYKRNKRLQQEEATSTVAESTTPRQTPGPTRTGVSVLNPSPRIVVEIPSPRRGRGRPPKTQQRNSDGDTVEVVHSDMPSHARTATQAPRKEEFEKVQSRKNRNGQREVEANSKEFSAEEREMLLDAAPHILAASEDKVDIGWKNMAEEHDTHTAEEWKIYFNEVILPLHRIQQEDKQPAVVDFEVTEDQADNAHDDADAQSSSEVVQQTGRHLAHLRAKVEKQAGNDEVIATKWKGEQRQRSPSFQPQSPTGWKSENDSHRTGPNQSRKRSPAKTNSQESTESQSSGQPREEEAAPLRSTGVKQSSSMFLEDVYSRSVKRRKLSHTETNALEIPSTPENMHESETPRSETLEDLPSSPTPRARKRSAHGSQDLFSPVFVPRDSADEEEQLPTTPQHGPKGMKTIDRGTGTSPLSIHLVSDHDPTTASSSSARNKDAKSESTASLTPEFETAPDFSHLHEDEEEFETAAEKQGVKNASLIPDTQALFATTTQNGGVVDSLDLGELPEPEGGWDAIEVAAQNDTGEPDKATSPPHSPTPSTPSTASTLNLDLDTWLSLRIGEGQDPSLLLTAAEATNMHKKLADAVYASLERGEGVPRDVRGVWTKEDDEVLMGTDARGIARVERKHGKTSVEERWECLGVWREEG